MSILYGKIKNIKVRELSKEPFIKDVELELKNINNKLDIANDSSSLIFPLFFKNFVKLKMSELGESNIGADINTIIHKCPKLLTYGKKQMEYDMNYILSNYGKYYNT